MKKYVGKQQDLLFCYFSCYSRNKGGTIKTILMIILCTGREEKSCHNHLFQSKVTQVLHWPFRIKLRKMTTIDNKSSPLLFTWFSTEFDSRFHHKEVSLFGCFSRRLSISGRVLRVGDTIRDFISSMMIGKKLRSQVMQQQKYASPFLLCSPIKQSRS